MFGRFTLSAAAACAVLTATPAFAATEDPVGGQGGLWTQEAPTSFFNTEMGAVLGRGVQYISGGGPAINYRYGFMNGGQFDWNLSGIFNTTTNLAGGIGAGVGYKQQFIRQGGTAIAWRLGVGANGVGGPGSPAFGLSAQLPMTFDAGRVLVSVAPGFFAPNVQAFGTASSVQVPVGIQAPVARYWSFLGEVAPNFALGTNAFTLPVALGARLSPTALSHVDFSLANIAVTPGFGLSVGTIGVTGHVGFK